MSTASIEQIVSEQVEQFRAYLRADKKSKGTIKQYGEAVTQLFEVCKKNTESLTPEDMQRFKAFLSVKYNENSMYSRVSAVNQYTDKMLHRPDLKMRAPKMVHVTKIPLTEEEVRAIREASSHGSAPRRDVALIDVMYYGGLRCAEVSQLTISCLDLDKNRLRVNAGKGKNYDMVNLAPEAVKSLREYIANERPEPVNGAIDHLFLGRDGRPLCKTQIWKITKKHALSAGISKNVHPHIFRHSMITHMAEKGLPAQMIQAQSRHKSLDMVARYTHLSDKSVRTAYDSVFSPAPAPARPIPDAPAPTHDALTREDVLRARLEGKIDTATMESMLGHIEGTTSPSPRPQKMTLGYA